LSIPREHVVCVKSACSAAGHVNRECKEKHDGSFGFTKYIDRKQENYSKARKEWGHKKLTSVPKLYRIVTALQAYR